MTVFPPIHQMLTMHDFPRPEMARALSPNGRAHWTKKMDARDYVHERVWFHAETQGLDIMVVPVTMRPIFIFPVKRARDDDNLATGVLKAVRDALVRNLILQADDMEHLRQLPVEVRIEKGRRALILEFTEVVA